LYIPESFDTDISHQLFDYTITFVNSALSNTNGNFVHKTGFKRSFKDFWYTKINVHLIIIKMRLNPFFNEI